LSSLPAVANTRAPAWWASCTAADPTPPAAAWITAVSPRASRPRSNSANQERWNGKKTAAASASGMSAGISKAHAAAQTACSA
jgi:hypothetical protein